MSDIKALFDGLVESFKAETGTPVEKEGRAAAVLTEVIQRAQSVLAMLGQGKGAGEFNAEIRALAQLLWGITAMYPQPGAGYPSPSAGTPMDGSAAGAGKVAAGAAGGAAPAGAGQTPTSKSVEPDPWAAVDSRTRDSYK